jgi:hypothetical protein
VRIKKSLVFIFAFCLPLVVSSLQAQDLGPHFTKIKDGIYVQTAKSTPQANSNASIILTTEGVVLVDTGQTAIDSH